MLKGKKGIIFGIANDHSIAWGIAEKLHQHGADLAITYQNNTLLKRVKPLADKVNCNCLIECDVSKEEDLNKTLTTIINDKIYKKDKSIIEIIYSFIELYFRNNISSENISLLKSYHYFLEKINNTKIYNLDEETLFMEFEDKILNG